MTPFDRSRATLPTNIRRTLEESNLPIEVATAIADLCEEHEPLPAVMLEALDITREAVAAQVEGLPRPTRGQIEAFRREQQIPDDGKLEAWAIEENMVLKYLCDLALSPPAACDPLALLRELNDALAIPERFQARVDAVLDRAEEKS